MKNYLLKINKSQIENEILAYFLKYPDAQDTIKGIVEWWLLERKIEIAIAIVQEALKELVTRGLIIEFKGKNSRTHYRINPNKHKDIQELFN